MIEAQKAESLQHLSLLLIIVGIALVMVAILLLISANGGFRRIRESIKNRKENKKKEKNNKKDKSDMEEALPSPDPVKVFDDMACTQPLHAYMLKKGDTKKTVEESADTTVLRPSSFHIRKKVVMTHDEERGRRN